MPDETEQRGGPRAFWSGTISFGLVSIPVSLHPATRTERVALRSLSPAGAPLRREYYCPEHERPVHSDEIARGYEISDGKFVMVSDDELDALAPEKSRDIDLRRFVPLAELPPETFERALFMAPSSESTKAYRLLADTLEKTGRAGIATFVMRGKEYLVAILSERGLLRAETLRFADEIRSPEDVGLPEPVEPDARQVNRMKDLVDKLKQRSIAASELQDETLARTRKLIERKLEQGKDVVHVSEQERATAGDADIIDLMEVLKRSLGKETAARSRSKKGTKSRAVSHKPKAANDTENLTKQELYEKAQALDIEGRSQMSKPELAKAVRRARASSKRRTA